MGGPALRHVETVEAVALWHALWSDRQHALAKCAAMTVTVERLRAREARLSDELADVRAQRERYKQRAAYLQRRVRDLEGRAG